MERTALAGAVAEEHHRHPPRALLPGSESRPQGQRHRAPHHAAGGDETRLRGHDMHGPALAAAVAGGAPRQLGHEPVHVRPLGDGVSVGTVPAEHRVIGVELAADPYRHGFLPDAEMEQADDLPGRVERGHLLLKGADHPHAPEQRHQLPAAVPARRRLRSPLLPCFHAHPPGHSVGWLGVPELKSVDTNGVFGPSRASRRKRPRSILKVLGSVGGHW